MDDWNFATKPSVEFLARLRETLRELLTIVGHKPDEIENLISQFMQKLEIEAFGNIERLMSTDEFALYDSLTRQFEREIGRFNKNSDKLLELTERFKTLLNTVAPPERIHEIYLAAGKSLLEDYIKHISPTLSNHQQDKAQTLVKRLFSRS